jgi:hypothetical protein
MQKIKKWLDYHNDKILSDTEFYIKNNLWIFTFSPLSWNFSIKKEDGKHITFLGIGMFLFTKFNVL